MKPTDSSLVINVVRQCYDSAYIHGKPEPSVDADLVYRVVHSRLFGPGKPLRIRDYPTEGKRRAKVRYILDRACSGSNPKLERSKGYNSQTGTRIVNLYSPAKEPADLLEIYEAALNEIASDQDEDIGCCTGGMYWSGYMAARSMDRSVAIKALSSKAEA